MGRATPEHTMYSMKVPRDGRYSAALVDLINSCLEFNPGDRCNLQHMRQVINNARSAEHNLTKGMRDGSAARGDGIAARPFMVPLGADKYKIGLAREALPDRDRGICSPDEVPRNS